jgi:hypothetical protein
VAVAQAEADLADRKRTLAQQAGGGRLGRLNERLVETQIAITTYMTAAINSGSFEKMSWTVSE